MQQLLQADDNFDTIVSLMSERAELVEQHLQRLSGSELRNFAEKELAIQSELLSFTDVTKLDIANQLDKIARGKKMLKGYKK